MFDSDVEIDSYANRHFTDFVLEVETKFVDGTDDNLLRAECVGNNLRLLVNGHLLTKMTDNMLTGGDITLGVTSLGGYT